ncbi:Wzz/FepE/Etk N-terminal domain-containing protein [Chitinophagaceae bacterium MMS25-I14]
MTPRFDLVDIAKNLLQRKMFIVVVSVLGAALGAVFYLIQAKKFKAQSEIIVSNPKFADRANLFRNTDIGIDYFADEDDVDRVIAIAQSTSVRDKIIDSMRLAYVYQMDLNNPKRVEMLHDIFKKAYDVKRTEYKNMEISYTDTDPQRAADVTNAAVSIIEKTYRGYYSKIKAGIYRSIEEKVRESDSTINALTDTLATLRDRYQIYDIISPGRANMVSGIVKNNGKADFGKGVEIIQNIEAIKDAAVLDRAKYYTLLSEFSAGTSGNDIQFVQVISKATPPVKHAGLGGILTVVACGIAAFFLSIVIVLLGAYLKELKTATEER